MHRNQILDHEHARRRTALLRAGAFLATSMVLVLAACEDRSGEKQGNEGSSIAAPAPAASPAATAVPPALPSSDAPIAGLVIPSIRVERETIEGKVDPNGRMIAPVGAFDVAYYSYSGRPGKGNAVFSGHVDYVNIGPAVFWDLQHLKEGDEVVVKLADGTQMKYAVKFNVVYDAANGPWQSLFGAQAVADGVTIYTCDGDFDPASGSYDERRVVRAERIG